MSDLDCRLQTIIDWIRENTDVAAGRGALVPVSGGSDSALGFWLCAQALPPGRAIGAYVGTGLRCRAWFEQFGPLRLVPEPHASSHIETTRWAPKRSSIPAAAPIQSVAGRRRWPTSRLRRSTDSCRYVWVNALRPSSSPLRRRRLSIWSRCTGAIASSGSCRWLRRERPRGDKAHASATARFATHQRMANRARDCG